MRLLVCSFLALALACSTTPEETVEPRSDVTDPGDSGDAGDAPTVDVQVGDQAVDSSPPDDIMPELPPPPPYCADNDLECGFWTNEDTDLTVSCGNCPTIDLWCTPTASCETSPSCGPGGLSANTKFQWESSIDWAPAPGGDFAAILQVRAANPQACQWCDRAIIAERFPPLNDDSTSCHDIGPVNSCKGHTAGTVVLPMHQDEGESQTHYRLSLGPPGVSCKDEWQTLETGKSFDEVQLAVPAPGNGCSEACEKRQCGLVIGCGLEHSCGNCPPGHLCDNHQCAVAPPCAIDELTITDVLLDGFKHDAEANPGEEVPALFSWTLSGAAADDDNPRQLVVGIGNTPGFCVDVGYVQNCPSLSAGLANGTFLAPFEAGAYALEAAVIAEQDCATASALFAEAWPRQTLGTVTVEGTCSPLTCQQLGAHCGFQADGCNGSIHCGRCTPGIFCQTGTCDLEPACAGDSFDPLLLDLQAQGPHATVAPDGLVAFSLSLQAATGADCPSCNRLVAIAVGEKVAFCHELTDLPQCPEYYATGVGSFFAPPQTPGTYPVRTALLMEDDCDLAQETFGNYGSIAIGSLTVEGTCTPFDCATLDKECSDWGDGCGGFLHCGQCGTDETCSISGSCDNPCTNGFFEVQGISINGSGTVASSPPDKSVQVNLGYEVGNSEDCPGCPIQIVVGVDNDPLECSAAGAPAACPDTATGDLTTHITAPSTAGIYSIYAWPSTAADCESAKGEFIANPERTKLGTLYVTDGCSPKSCLSMGKKCGAWEDGCGITLQCGTCPVDELCDAMGSCYCSSADEFEPNNSADNAYDFGDKTDNDGSSHVTIQAAVNQESDWFRMGATDKQWAYMEPFVEVTPGNPAGFKAIIAFRCLDGTYPATYNAILDSGCDLVKNTSYPGLGSVSSAWECTPIAGIIAIHFGPHCALLDDSGELFVAVSNQGPCSAYELDLHL
jgi:hypothetical protein